MKRGVIVLIVFLAIILIFFLQTQNNNFITSFATKTDNIDVKIDLSPLSREIKQGENIRVSTRIDTHDYDMIDVGMNYIITNDKGIVVFQKSRTLAVERTAKVIETLMIHKTLDPGSYLVDVEVKGTGRIKVERDTFEVVAEPVVAEPSEITFGNKEATLLLIVLIMLIIFFILLWIQNRKVDKILKAHEKCDMEHVIR